MNDHIMRFVVALVAICLFALIASQAYTSLTEEYNTETAVIYSSADRTSFRGVYIRNESVIKQYVDGVLCFSVSDGSKVANGSVVASVYANESDIDVVQRIEEIRAEIELLEASQNPGTTSTAQPEFISGLITQDYQSLTTCLAKADVSGVNALRDNMLTLMCIYQISVGKENGYNDRISSLNSELSSLLARGVSPKSTVSSPDSGYFVSYTDGYEDILSTDSTDSLTADQIKAIVNETGGTADRDNREIGKLIRGYDWKIAGVIDNSANVYNPGDSVKLSFASTPGDVDAVIERLDPAENPAESVIVLRCEEMTYDLVQKRVERVEMTLNDFEGIKVPREAMRFNRDNEKGVYVLWGQRVLFKKLDVIFESDDYVLSKITSDEDYVCVYDEIILEGVDTASFMSSLEDKLDQAEDSEDAIVKYTSAEQQVKSETVYDPIIDMSAVTEAYDDQDGGEQTEVTVPPDEGGISFE